jgi:hypothetical protein
MNPSRWRGARSLAAQTTNIAYLQGYRRSTRAVPFPEVLSEGVAKRRRASPVPQMCPFCVRVFCGQTTQNAHLQAFLCKPSDGLEPSTPSLPSRFRGNGSQPMATDLA